jgi:hypothetical protein
MGGQPKSKASSLSSVELGQLREEPTAENGPKPGSVGILALEGEDVERAFFPIACFLIVFRRVWNGF